MPSRNLVFLLVATVACVASWYARHRDLRGHRVNEVLAHIVDSYLDPVDAETLVRAAIEGAVARLDEHSAFLPHAELRDLEVALDQQLGGVGLELGVAPGSGEPTVIAPVVGGPAWRAGVAADDRIEAVDGVAVRGRPFDDVVRGLRGRPGTEVLLRIVPASDGGHPEPRDVRLVREVIRVESLRGDRRNADGSWEWFLEGEPGVAYLRLAGFGERTLAEFDAALEAIGSAAGLRGLVIDLRGNPGGLLVPAVELCDRLLDEGVIVSTRGRPGSPGGGAVAADVRRARAGAVLPGVPIAVLIDGLTASSAEIVAACLQDHGRATVVGSRSFGKGTVQSILNLSDGAALKLTTSQYERPSGGRIHRLPDDGAESTWGVSPNPGFAVAPSAAALDRLRDWRRRRDVPGPRIAPSGPLPTQVDEVLARALEVFRPASDPVPQFGREEETAGHADRAPRAGV